MISLRESIGDLSHPAPDSNMYWAQGCGNCHQGIVSAPERTGAVALYAERLVQCADGDVTFCACRAGVLARQYMLRLWKARQAEVKGMAGKLDEVDWARARVMQAYAMATPTIREQE